MTPSEIDSCVNGVNERLEAGEPANVSVDTYSGYSGYKPQYVIDAMNAVFGYGNWGFEELSNEIAEGDKAVLVISQVKVWLKDVGFTPTGWGQARVTKGDIGDAKKGAQTDALKKALSYFSIGNRAYMGLLPTETNNRNQGNNGNARSNGGVAPTPAQKQQAQRPAPVPPQTPAQTETQPASLDSVPSADKLKAEIETGKYLDNNGRKLTWPNFLGQAFAQQIAKREVTVQQLINAGSEIPYDACKLMAAKLATLKRAA